MTTVVTLLLKQVVLLYFCLGFASGRLTEKPQVGYNQFSKVQFNFDVSLFIHLLFAAISPSPLSQLKKSPKMGKCPNTKMPPKRGKYPTTKMPLKRGKYPSTKMPPKRGKYPHTKMPPKREEENQLFWA